MVKLEKKAEESKPVLKCCICDSSISPTAGLSNKGRKFCSSSCADISEEINQSLDARIDALESGIEREEYA